MQIPPLQSYLNSPNPTVVTFCIKLVLDYQQLESIPKLITLLKHDVTEVRLEAINTLGKLYALEAEPELIKLYHQSDPSTKVKIIDAIGLIASGNSLGFLQSEFLNTQEFILLKAIGCALVNQPKFEHDTFVGNSNGLSEIQETIINHCSNVLIRN